MDRLVEIVSDFILGSLGLSLFFMLDIVARRKKSEKFKKVFSDAHGWWAGYYTTMLAYFTEDPFDKTVLILWVIIVAILGDIPVVADLLPDIQSRHVLIFVAGLLSPFLIDKITIMFTSSE